MTKAKRYTPEEKSKILKEAKTNTVEEVVKKHGISAATLYNWKNTGRKTRKVVASGKVSSRPTQRTGNLREENTMLKSLLAEVLLERLDGPTLKSLLQGKRLSA